MLLKLGIIGTGYFSKIHSDILSTFKDLEIKAILGTSQEKADTFARLFSQAKGYSSLVQMLDSENLDAVYICTPPMSHGPIELELIKRGIPFFVEKPLATNLKIPTKILSELKKSPVMTSVGYHFRYKKSVQQLKTILSDQKVGMVMGQWSGEMPMVPWWRKQEQSGGQFIEQTTHLVDLLRYVCGDVDEVFGFYGNRVMQDKVDSVTVPDVGSVTMKLSTGVVATISNTCILPSGVHRTGLSFYTDKGIVDYTPDLLTVNYPGEVLQYKDSENAYIIENQIFINAVRSQDSSGILSSYEDAYKTQEVTCGALESVDKGVTIKLR
ncbi:Gfo/Idh/MocA family protein [Litchfieldia alkalitelluris]|uniref:Gfo/Idh/MocA family protein n=1 Tax=Litchfieldia alkalitelluris TaxID=304268 RepID=UPI000996E2D0|nr:Gfo/Idh/MocA family oxidoreductase [Litchfieldia alkalitelluris]